MSAQTVDYDSIRPPKPSTARASAQLVGRLVPATVVPITAPVTATATLTTTTYDSTTPWQTASACSEANWSTYNDSTYDRETSPESFFPKRIEGGQCAPAKSLCQQCPVRMQCLQEGLREPTGVWGGLSEMERREAQKMVRAGRQLPEILAYFDAREPQRRRKTNFTNRNLVVEASGMTGLVIEDFLPTNECLPAQQTAVSIPQQRTTNADASDLATIPVPSIEIRREQERRRNGLR